MDKWSRQPAGPFLKGPHPVVFFLSNGTNREYYLVA